MSKMWLPPRQRHKRCYKHSTGRLSCLCGADVRPSTEGRLLRSTSPNLWVVGAMTNVNVRGAMNCATTNGFLLQITMLSIVTSKNNGTRFERWARRPRPYDLSFVQGNCLLNCRFYYNTQLTGFVARGLWVLLAMLDFIGKLRIKLIWYKSGGQSSPTRENVINVKTIHTITALRTLLSMSVYNILI